MKKLFFALFAVLFVIILSNAAHAGYKPSPGGSADGVVSVAEAKTRKDDTMVRVQGYIIKHIKKDHYVLQDSSGTVRVEIDDHIWGGVDVSEKDKVEIYGEIDKDHDGIKIDAESVKKL